MIEIIIYLAVGYLLGLYTGSKVFRTKLNSLLKPIWGLLTRLEFRNNHKTRNNRKDKTQVEGIDYETFYNRGYYCVLPKYNTLRCGGGYCRDCPTYREHKQDKEKEDKQRGKPLGFNEDYW